MSEAKLSRQEVQQVAEAVLGREVAAHRHPVGFGNDNWVVRDGHGAPRWILKVGAPESEAKWRSAHEALALASSVGVPVPELVHVDTHEGSLVRVFTWIDGKPPSSVMADRAQLTRFVSSLAEAIRALHSIDTRTFSSRLDGSAPRFDRWGDYLGARLEAVRERCVSTAAMDADSLDRAGQAILELAEQVSPHARATLCHRDLHGDNLLVDGTGTLVGVIDWDAAESWDAAGEWFKLDWLLTPELGIEPGQLSSAYHGGRAEAPAWQERVRVVHLIEALNVVPNAVVRGHTAFGDRARHHLSELLGLH